MSIAPGLNEREIEIDGAMIHDFKLTDHFWLSEFRLHWPRKVPVHDRFPILCPDVKVASKFARDLEILRARIKKPIIITDCLRPAWSLRFITGAAKHSRHLTQFLKAGIMAVDCKVPAMSMRTLYDHAEWLMDRPEHGFFQGGLGYYFNHVHMDNRGVRTRWGTKSPGPK